MMEQLIHDTPALDEPGAREHGATFILTPEGWEEVDFVAPGDDWGRQSDGSYVSPDGAFRTWPAGGGEVSPIA
jgi:hypothetical protein